MRAVTALKRGRWATLETVDAATLLEGEIGIDVEYSSLNYKDGLAILGRGIARRWPLILGIDVIGVVTDSPTPAFAVGARVALNGSGIGETYHGGFAEQARVSAHALIRIQTPSRTPARPPLGLPDSLPRLP